jgi:hypothetical protein
MSAWRSRKQEEENNISIAGRTIKKTDFFKPISPKKKSKHGNSLSVSIHTAKAKNSVKKKVKKGDECPYGDGEVC